MLHPDDEKALTFNFDPDDDADDRERRIADALGLDLNAIRGLAGTILSDLPTSLPADDAPESSFGIQWWSGYSGLGTARRLLIGDYLIEAVNAIETNIVEARIHLSSVRAAHLAMMSDLHPTSALSLANGGMGELHISGMLRAATSAVDCLGAVMVGVLGLPLDIKFADIGTVRKKWRTEKVPKLPPSKALTFQTTVVDEVLACFDGLAPSGWLPWASNFRNTFVHRGRRHQTWHPQVGLRLPSEPNHSDVEAMVSSTYPEALHEPSEVTLMGIMKNVQDGAFKACVALLNAWKHRRENPSLIEQPREQWKTLPKLNEGVSFKGFAPRELSNVDAVRMHPTSPRRLGSAAVSVAHRDRWAKFS